MGSRQRKINMKKAKEAVAPLLGGGRSEFFRVDTDDEVYEVRVLGPLDDMQEPWLEHWFHDNRVAGNYTLYEIDGSLRTLHCLESHSDERCPVCQIIEWCDESGEDAGLIKLDHKFFMNVIVDDKLQVWDAPPSVVIELKKTLNNPKYGERTFDPIKGRGFDVTRYKKKGGFYAYRVEVDPNPSKIALLNWEEDAPVLSNFIKVYPREEVLQIVQENLGTVFPLDEIFGKRAAKGGVVKKTTTKRPAKKVVKKKVAKKPAKKR